MKTNASILFGLATSILFPLFATAVPDGTGEADGVEYGVGNWPAYIDNTIFCELGNHRAVIQVDQVADAVSIHIPWRRRDDAPEQKDVVIIAAADHSQVTNRLVLQSSRESGDFVFEPTAGPGTYYAYYFPHRTPDSFYKKGFNVDIHFPQTEYFPPRNTASSEWVKAYNANKDSIPNAHLVCLESRTAFDSFYPMEVIATPAEVELLVASASGQPMLLFPENRKFPIRMTEDLPFRWVEKGPSSQFIGKASPNEYYAFQIGVYALRDLTGLTAAFSDLTDESGAVIPAAALTCFNNGGTDWLGRPFSKTVDVLASHVQALWFGVDIANDTPAGTYRGTVTLSAQNEITNAVELVLHINGQPLADRGDSEIWRHSRLRWLNSNLGIDEELVAPFTPVEYHNQTISILGRTITLNDLGLPTSVKSFFEISELKEEGREVLAAPIHFTAEINGAQLAMVSSGLKVLHHSQGKLDIQSTGDWAHGTWVTDVSAEMDGYLRYRITFKAEQDCRMDGAKLVIPVKEQVARYSKLAKTLGGARVSSPTTASLDGGLFYNLAWMGDYNAGIACRPKNDEDEWNGDNKTKSQVPIAQVWSNNKTGEYRIVETNDTVSLIVDSGTHTLTKGSSIHFNFALFVTPFKPVRADHWDFRYYHTLHGTTPKLETAIEGRARYITSHHGSSQNPNINYPFLNADELRRTSEAARKAGLGQKIYYTVRELSVYAPELWALRSLGDEIIMPGNGYRELSKKPAEFLKSHFNRSGFPWSCEHLVSNYINRWHTYVDGDKNHTDASISVQGLSRWHNYYIEGLKWLIENTGISGIYLDGIGYDRAIMKRVRKTLTRSNPASLIDYHSSELIPVLEHMPYLDSVWIGEGADYSKGPDYWLVEVSGIPFGLSGETLKEDASPYRAMLYGMARRYGWIDGDPTAIWKWWDEFDIQSSRMVGFWDLQCPVKTSHSDIQATAYVKQGKAVAIVIASWAETPEAITLSIQWEALGLNPDNVHLFRPEIKGFQDGAASISLDQPIMVDPDKGVIITIELKNDS